MWAMKLDDDLKKKLFYDEATADNEFEVCVICHSETAVKKSTPIDQRECYIRGVGQLCKKCYLQRFSR
jgi:hypothetical protein